MLFDNSDIGDSPGVGSNVDKSVVDDRVMFERPGRGVVAFNF